MKISIITICKNSEATIEKTILSVVSQEYRNIEYIIIDGGSCDGTMSIVKKYSPRIAIIVSEPDRGISDAFNKGLSYATGDLVAFLNADDFYRDATVITTVANSFVDTNTILCGAILQSDRFGEKAKILKSLPEKLKYGMYVRHPATFVPKDLFELYGNFCERYKIAMDYDLCLRFMLKGAKYAAINQVLTVMTTGGVSGDAIKAMNEELLIKKDQGVQGPINWLYFESHLMYAKTKRKLHLL